MTTLKLGAISHYRPTMRSLNLLLRRLPLSISLMKSWQLPTFSSPSIDDNISPRYRRQLRKLGAYFTAPKVSPRTSCFCISHPSTMIGATAKKEAAESLAQNSPSGLEWDAIKTVRGAACALNTILKVRLKRPIYLRLCPKPRFGGNNRSWRPSNLSPIINHLSGITAHGAGGVICYWLSSRADASNRNIRW